MEPHPQGHSAESGGQGSAGGPAGARKPRSGAARFFASALLSVLLVTWLLRDVGWLPIVQALRSAAPAGVAAGVMMLVAMVAARVWRYRLLLLTPVALTPLTLIVLVRGMLADLLPARIGTLAYVWLITRRARVPLEDALSSFLLALVLDMAALAPLLLVALAAISGWQTGRGLALLSLALLAASAAALWLLAPALRLAARLLPGAGWRGRLARACGSTARNLDAVRRRGRLLPAFALSLLVRLTKFSAHWLLLQAVLVPLGVPWGGMPFANAFLGIAGAELSAMLPLSGLAAIGTWETAFTVAFTRLGLSQQQAIVSGFATHALTQAFDYGTGLLALLALMRPRSAAAR